MNLIIPLLPLLLLLLLLLLHSGSGNACNLTESRRAANGLVHRCVSNGGANEWRRNVACWLASDIVGAGSDIELEVGDIYRSADGRQLAECRQRWRSAALVWLSCSDAGSWRSAGQVWTNSSGQALTCAEAGLAGSRYFDRSAKVIAFGCQSNDANASLAAPNSTLLRDDGIELRCAFSGADSSEPRFGWFQIVGCWLRGQAGVQRAAVGQNFTAEAALLQDAAVVQRLPQLPVASCWKRSRYSRVTLRLLACRLVLAGGVRWVAAGSTWRNATGSGSEPLECRLASAGSARPIELGCRDASGRLRAPAATAPMRSGRVMQCAYTEREHSYSWSEISGCWQRSSVWRKFGNETLQLRLDEKFCPAGGDCVAVCRRRRYRSQVAIVQLRCLRHVGSGHKFRRPGENWTDDTGLSRTCLPMLNQRNNFGAGAQTAVRGCARKNSSAVAPPGSARLDADQLVRECRLDENAREFKFGQIVGCWLRDSAGRVVQLRIGASLRSSRGRVASCRRKSRYSRPELVADVCFNDNSSSLLNWTEAALSLPGKVRGGQLQCNKSAGSDSARWIAFGCSGGSRLLAPGSERLDKDDVIRRCAPNGREGARAEFAWAEVVGCWYRNHHGNVVRIVQFNKRMADGAECHRSSRYSDPELKLMRCLSAANRRVYAEGENWLEAGSNVTKQCVAKSNDRSDDVVAIDYGCWLTVSRGNASETRQFKNGTMYFGPKNQVLRCDFNTRKRKYDWMTSVACWRALQNGTKAVMPISDEIHQDGQLVLKCHSYRGGAKLLQHACRFNGKWLAPLTTWQTSRVRYSCEPAQISSGRSAKAERTHCITDDGQAITASATVKGVTYLCMRVCGHLLNFRQPTPRQTQFAFDFVNRCHATKSLIIGNIG